MSTLRMLVERYLRAFNERDFDGLGRRCSTRTWRSSSDAGSAARARCRSPRLRRRLRCATYPGLQAGARARRRRDRRARSSSSTGSSTPTTRRRRTTRTARRGAWTALVCEVYEVPRRPDPHVCRNYYLAKDIDGIDRAPMAVADPRRPGWRRSRRRCGASRRSSHERRLAGRAVRRRQRGARPPGRGADLAAMLRLRARRRGHARRRAGARAGSAVPGRRAPPPRRASCGRCATAARPMRLGPGRAAARRDRSSRHGAGTSASRASVGRPDRGGGPRMGRHRRDLLDRPGGVRGRHRGAHRPRSPSWWRPPSSNAQARTELRSGARGAAARCGGWRRSSPRGASQPRGLRRRRAEQASRLLGGQPHGARSASDPDGDDRSPSRSHGAPRRAHGRAR